MAKLDYAPNNFRGVTPTLTPIEATKTPYKPDKGLLQGHPYTPAAKTDVTETWRKFGWLPNDKTRRTSDS